MLAQTVDEWLRQVLADQVDEMAMRRRVELTVLDQQLRRRDVQRDTDAPQAAEGRILDAALLDAGDQAVVHTAASFEVSKRPTELDSAVSKALS